MKKLNRNDAFDVNNGRCFPNVTMPYEEVPVDLSVLVAGMRPGLLEMIGPNIVLQMNLEREGLWVKANARLIEQVVNNLITNAADSMPQGGTITFETKRVNVGPDLVKQKVSESKDFYGLEVFSPSEGNHARLSVRDTGMGMDPATKRDAFNPFFTTKAVGKGTGLGLSVVDGIVKQSGGWISMESDLDRGTCVEIYLREISAPVS